MFVSKVYTINGTKEVNNMPNTSRNNSNQLVVPGAEQALNQMKTEIASEFGVQLGADTTSRGNGSVGGEITKRLVHQAQQQIDGGSQIGRASCRERGEGAGGG